MNTVQGFNSWFVVAFGLSLAVGNVEAEGGYLLGLYLHKGKDHGSLTGSDLLMGLAQLGSQRLPLLLQQGSCTTTQEILVYHGATAASTLSFIIVNSFWYTTIWFLLQLLSESRLADMVHEFEQILPALPPEAGLHMTQESQVLLPRVCLGEQILKGLPEREQDLLVINWLVPASDRK